MLWVVVMLAQPAGAADSLTTTRQKRDAARQRRAALAARLDHLKASDTELESAVSLLDKEVRVQQARADDARQGVQAAMAVVAEAEARMSETEHRMHALREAVVERAVSAYVRPEDDPIAGVIAARDLSEASRRSSLLAEVANHDRDVMDELRAVRQDLGEEHEKAARARDVAAQRRRAVLDRLSVLQRTQMEKQRLSAALTARIREYQAEADEVARQESGLTALIKAKERPVAAPATAVDGRVSGAGLSWPVRGPVTSRFGRRWGRQHAGIDIGAGKGVPIKAAKAGEVIFAGTMGGYGNAVVIDHGSGLTTLYAHQSRLGTSDGTSVASGDVIGYVGSTGHSTGPHLHFETRVGGTPQDPLRYLP